jgi:hypothetical protein
VPPLAATIAATLAVGFGVSLARAARSRHSAGRLARDRQLGLQPAERLAHGLQRMALAQLDLAIELLGDGAPDARAVHETRKALKRLRTLFLLLEAELGKQELARERAVLRDAARGLAEARDAEVMLATLDALIERHPRKLAGRAGVKALRGRLLDERQRTRRPTLDELASSAQALAQLRACRARVAAWSLPDGDGIALIEPGLLRLYRQGRTRYRRAAGGKGDRVRTMHEWRKPVKDLRYAAEMLDARQHDARLRRLARRADKLGELLGEDHDLAVLAELIRGQKRIGSGTRKRLAKLIARRRRELRRRALRQGERLYGRSPKRFVRGVQRARRRAQRRLS